MINQKTQLNMVIGFPLEHTKSPLLHNTIYNALNINAVLLAFPNNNLPSLIKSIKTLSIGLTAVTMPYKEKVLKYLDYYSPEVKTLKAANTIIQREGKLYGHNTDVDGIKYALRDISLLEKNVLVIGAGGAARAAALVLKDNHSNIFWLNRTKKKAIALSKIFGGKVIDSDKLKELDIDIIINTTPLGMHPNIDVSPLPNYTFNANQTIFDMVYNPMDTQLLKQAQKSNAKIINGLDMFVGQGLKQIELFKDVKILSIKMINDIKSLLIRGSV
jgi:shikimate dehydrogenase